MKHQLPCTEHGPVLAGIKAKPNGWPAASPDPDSGRGSRAASGRPAARIQQIQGLYGFRGLPVSHELREEFVRRHHTAFLQGESG